MRIKLDIPIPTREIEKLFPCDFPQDTEKIEYVCTDSRNVCQSDLYFALSNSDKDIISHINQAKEKGGYVAAECYALKTGCTASYDAILKLAALYKSHLTELKSTVVITGSIGKTTTKELTSILIREKYTVHSTTGNQNNRLGASYTILSAPKDTEILILEVGMNHEGEIAPIAELVEPDIAVITNITNAHIGNLGSRKAIAKEKLSVCSGMGDSGITIIPHEEFLLQDAKNKRTVSLTDPRANFFLFPLELKRERSTFDFYSESTVLTAKSIQIPGMHILNSTAYALAVASCLKFKKQELENGLSRFSDDFLRQKLKTIQKYKIYDDTYSSSPDAVKNMLSLLKIIAENRSALLGDMLELGSYSENAHYEIGRYAYLSGIKKLYTFGSFANTIARGALDVGMSADSVFINTDTNAPAASAIQIANSYNDETILVKASRALRAERILDYLSNYK